MLCRLIILRNVSYIAKRMHAGARSYRYADDISIGLMWIYCVARPVLRLIIGTKATISRQTMCSFGKQLYTDNYRYSYFMRAAFLVCEVESHVNDCDDTF